MSRTDNGRPADRARPGEPECSDRFDSHFCTRPAGHPQETHLDHEDPAAWISTPFGPAPCLYCHVCGCAVLPAPKGSPRQYCSARHRKDAYESRTRRRVRSDA